MPVETAIRKCKYCDNMAKVNYNGIKRRHKGYYRTCGSKECITNQYTDRQVCRSKAYINKNEKTNCDHCKQEFIKENSNHKWCRECVPNKGARMVMLRYGLSYPEHKKLIPIDGLCPICRKNKASVIDHCHATGRVRGILCNGCNMQIHILEDKEILKRALYYLHISW